MCAGNAAENFAAASTTPPPGEIALADDMSKPTTASIDRRVERLEESQTAMQASITALGTDVQLLKSDIGHIKELMGSRFSVVEGGLGTLTAKLDQLLTLGQSWAGDLTQSPAGRATSQALADIRKDVAALAKIVDANDADIRDAKGVIKGIRLIFGTSLLAVIASLASLAMQLMGGAK